MLARRSRWRRTSAAAAGRGRTTTDNTAGDGLVMPCQRERYADPKGPAALVRTFATTPPRPATSRRPGRPPSRPTEVSRSPRAAQRAYDTTLGWYAGCVDERGPAAVHAAASTGSATRRCCSCCATGTGRCGRRGRGGADRAADHHDRPPGSPAPSARSSATWPGCSAPPSTACAACRPAGPARSDPGSARSPRCPSARCPGMLTEVDLPPVPGVDRPWVGTEPRRAMSNVAATRATGPTSARRR